MKSPNVTQHLSNHFPTNDNIAEASHSFRLLCYLYRWLILCSIFLFMAGAGIWVLTQTPVYQASAQLLFEIQNPSAEPNENTHIFRGTTSEPQIETHIHQLKSHQHFKATAHHLALSNNAGYQSFLSRSAGTSLEQISWIQSVRRHIQEFEKMLSQWLPFLSFTPSQEHAKKRSLNFPEERFTIWLNEHVDIEQAQDPSSITITATAETPDFAAHIANMVATMYIYRNLPSQHHPAQPYLSWLKSQWLEPPFTKTEGQTKNSVQTFQIKRPDFKWENQSHENPKILALQSQLEMERFTIEKQLAQDKTQQDRSAKLGEDFDFINSNQWIALSTFQKSTKLLDFPKIQWIYAKRQEWIATIHRTLKEIPPNQLKVKTGHQKIAALYRLLANEIDRAYQVGTTQLNKARTNIQQTHQAVQEFNRLKAEVKQLESLYRVTRTAIKSKPMASPQQIETVGFSPATLPKYPAISHQTIEATLWGFPIGLGVGIGMAIFLEGINRKKRYLQDPDDLKIIKSGLQFLGRMPQASSTEEETISPFLKGPNNSDFFNEHIQHITESMQAFSSHEDSREWLITSPGHHEGKTLLAHSIAKVLVQQTSQPVLLIDANISHPTTHKMVPLHTQNDKAKGLSDFLLNKAEINSIVQDTNIPNLHVISTGNWSTLPPEEFQSNRFQQLLQWCKTTQFHVIIIGPPVLSTTSIMKIANQVEETMVIIRPETTSHDKIKCTIHQLENHGATISGIVFHQFVPKKQMAETEYAKQPTSQPSPPLSWERTQELQQTRQQLQTQEELEHGWQNPFKPTLVDWQQENSRLKAQLQELRNERDILANTAKFYSKFARASHEIPDLKSEDELSNTPRAISNHQN